MATDLRAWLAACDPSANTTPRQILQGVLAPFPLPWTPASLTVDDGADKSSRTSQFQQWLKNERFPGHERVTVSERAGEGLSVAFNVSVMRGQQCLRVPRRFFFGAHRDESSSLAINRPLFQAIQEHPALQQNASMRLVVALWLECTARGKQSFWWPYLQMLPRDFTIPLFYRADDWDALRGSLCYDSALRQLKTTLMQFVNLSRVIDMVRVKDGLDLPSLDWPTFAWCVAVCMTRQNRVQVDGGNDEENSELVLIPVWDLCNHRRGEMTTRYDPEAGEIQLYADKDYATDEPFYMCYGDRDNTELLLYSGFVDSGAPHESVSFPMAIPVNLQGYDARRKLLQSAGLSINMPACRLYADDPVRDDRLLFFVYILTMSEKDLQLKVQTTGASTTTTTLDALVAEARHSSLPVIMKWLQNRCQIIVGMHDAVIRRAEGSEDLSEQSRTILAYRQWEREALGRVEFKVSI